MLTFLDEVLEPLDRRHTAAVIMYVELPNADRLMVLNPLPQILILILHSHTDCNIDLSRISHNPICRGFRGQGFLSQNV